MMNHVVFVSFLVLTISICHIGVSGQYIQYNQDVQPVTDRRIDTATQIEYEYYDDLIEDTTTETSIPITTTKTTTTTTTTTTPKPITSYRFSTTHRNGFRPINFNNKKKFELTTKQYQSDSYTDASNDNAFIQKQNPLRQSVVIAEAQSPPPHLRNAISDINRRTTGKDYAQEKSSPTSIDSNNGNSNYFSRRYARFLFKSRTG